MSPRRPIPLIRQLEVKPVLELLGEVGAPIPRLLARARIPARVQDGGDGFVAARSMLGFVGQAAEHVEMEDLGWRAATRARVEQLGSWGRRVSRAWTLGDAIRTFCKLYVRDIPFVELGLASGPTHAWIWRRRDLTPKDRRGELHGEQFMLGSMVQVVRLAAGNLWTPPAIALESSSAT